MGSALLEKGRPGAPKKTHCKRGHAFTEQNTGRNMEGFKRCKRCDSYRLQMARELMRKASPRPQSDGENGGGQ